MQLAGVILIHLHQDSETSWKLCVQHLHCAQLRVSVEVQKQTEWLDFSKHWVALKVYATMDTCAYAAYAIWHAWDGKFGSTMFAVIFPAWVAKPHFPSSAILRCVSATWYHHVNVTRWSAPSINWRKLSKQTMNIKAYLFDLLVSCVSHLRTDRILQVLNFRQQSGLNEKPIRWGSPKFIFETAAKQRTAFWVFPIVTLAFYTKIKNRTLEYPSKPQRNLLIQRGEIAHEPERCWKEQSNPGKDFLEQATHREA